MTTMAAPGWAWCSRRISCRLLASPSWVTVQVFTTHRSARSPSPASAQPACSSSSLTYCVSYWLTLQPRVARRAFGGVMALDFVFGVWCLVFGVWFGRNTKQQTVKTNEAAPQTDEI